MEGNSGTVGDIGEGRPFDGGSGVGIQKARKERQVATSSIDVFCGDDNHWS
jgi:hypothetical protein